MKLRLEKKYVNMGEEIEVPDHAFDFVINLMGEGADIIYLVPADKESMIKSKAMEIAAHLGGLYP